MKLNNLEWTPRRYTAEVEVTFIDETKDYALYDAVVNDNGKLEYVIDDTGEKHYTTESLKELGIAFIRIKFNHENVLQIRGI